MRDNIANNFMSIIMKDHFLLKRSFEAIFIVINHPSNLEKGTKHRYSKNSFNLHGLSDKRSDVGDLMRLINRLFLKKF